ncbi:hypothetical protein IMZ48_45910 [Candidatus Bathyarchaeota archaeon]|nr:hypothetical protein [Candidatus Bathyarchaeota archaeon]
MLAEQNTDTRLRVEERKGERVIVDPTVTNSRIFMYFYFCINVGSLVGQIAMVFTEKYVGSFPSPEVTAHLANWWILGRILARIPPAYSSLPLLPLGPVVAEGLGTFSRGVGVPKETAGVLPSLLTYLSVQTFAPDWVRPRDVPEALLPCPELEWLDQEAQLGRWPPVQDPHRRTPEGTCLPQPYLRRLVEAPVLTGKQWMTYDDNWVDEVRRALMACRVFLFLIVFQLAYNQMTGNLTSQAATMRLAGAPNGAFSSPASLPSLTAMN